MQRELVTNPWEPSNGILALRTEPGLGVDVREDAMSKYRLR